MHALLSRLWSRWSRQSSPRRSTLPLRLEALEDRTLLSFQIPVGTWRDLVFDNARQLLYIPTTTGRVERYNVQTRTLLTPWVVGTSLGAADISLDGNFLYVGEGFQAGTVTVHKINLNTGAFTNLVYNTGDSFEGGVSDIAIAANGIALISVSFAGSGGTPPLQLHTPSDVFSVRTDTPDIFFGEVYQDRIITRGADRSTLFIAQENLSPGGYWIYDSATNSFPGPYNRAIPGGLGNLPTGVNRNGSLVAFGRWPTGAPLIAFDRNLNFAHGWDVNSANAGFAFDPSRDVAYVVESANDTISAIDTNTGAFLWRMPTDQNIGSYVVRQNGEMTVSGDGRWLFLAYQGGIRMYDVGGPPELSASSFASGEPGNSGSFITLSRTSLEPVTVDWATADGTAKAGQDYIAASGRVTFAPGETSQIVRVMVNADLLAEGEETFFIDFSNPSVSMPNRRATGFISPLPSPTLEVNPDYSLIEGDSGTTDAVFTLLLSPPSTRPTVVNYSTADGPAGPTGARAGTDYVTRSGNITFQPGETLKTVVVPVVGDTDAEPDEHFFLNLSSTAAFVANPQIRGFIAANDSSTPLPALSISDTAVTEGNTGITPAVLTVTLSEPSAQQVRVVYATGRASAYYSPPGFDYQTVNATTLTFNPSETVKTITINVTGDTLDEADEQFVVNLLAAVNAQIEDGSGEIAIADDDQVAVVIGDASVIEGDAGTVNVVFSVTQTTRSVLPIIVTWATADDTTVAGDDYVATSGTLTIDPGQTVPQTIAIAVRGDLLVEPDETFFVNLLNVVNAVVQDGQGTGTIVNDERSRITIDDASMAEGTTGAASLVFTVRLSEPSSQAVNVTWATAFGSASPADYFSATNTLTFAPGEQERTIAVTLITDAVDELDETFFLNLSNPVNAHLADSQALGRILDDDTAGITINDVAAPETPGGPVTFTVRLATRSDRTVRIFFGTGDGTAGTSDYVSTIGQLTFLAGETVKTLAVTINSDFLDEADETFQVKLSNAGGVAPIVDEIGIGTILDDDVPVLTVLDTSFTEGTGLTFNMTFTIRRSHGSTQTTTVAYATASGTATEGADYTPVSGTLTIAPQPTPFEVYVFVPVRSDAIHEDTETLFLNLSNPVNAVIGDGQGQGSIFDDDQVFLNIAPTTALEGNSGTPAAVFTAALSRLSELPVTARYVTAPGTATTDVDYQPVTGTLTIAPGALRQTVSVPLIGDTEIEPNETFTLTLSNVSGATLGTATGTATILDDDNDPDTLRVIAFTPTHTGFTVLFDQPIDPAVLNLYDTEAGGLGPADVALTLSGTPLRGSLAVDPSGQRITFIRTGGLLTAGTYSVTLRSAADGFQTPSGGQLDGNGDGVSGDDYTTAFAVTTPGFTISIPDFTRGPGQAVNLPATGAGIPLRINGSSVTSVSLTLRWDPALLSITGAVPAPGVPAGATVSTIFPEPGLMTLFFFSPTALPTNPADFVVLTAQVPETAPYGSKHVLDLLEPRFNIGFVNIREDEGIHVVGYLGDTTGNGGTSAADSRLASRVAVGLDGGFSAYQSADPLLLADINGNGVLNSTDALRILQEALGIDRPEIPPLPGLPVIVPGGPDPLLSIPKTFRARRGGVVTVPVNLDVSEGLTTADLALSYDNRRLELLGARRGTLTRDFDLFAVNHDPEAGTIRVGLGRAEGAISRRGSGSVLLLSFRIRPDAPAGRAVLNLRQSLGVTTTQLNEGGLDLNPDPSDETGDALDGVIAIRPGRVRPVPLPSSLVDAVFGLDGATPARRKRLRPG